MVEQALLLMPPELRYLPGLHEDDPVRRDLKGRVADAVRAMGFDGSLSVDEGVGALLKDQVARAIAHAGPVFLAGAPGDGPALAELERALARARRSYHRLTIEPREAVPDDDVFVLTAWHGSQDDLPPISGRWMRFRIAGAALRTPSGREEFGERLGLDRQPEMIRALVRRLAPAREREFDWVLELHELGIHPLLEAYLGNGILDRNRELLVNIVP